MNTNYPYFKELADVFDGVYSPKRLLCICLLTFVVFSLIINSSWKATPDSALYLELGESLASGSGYFYNDAPHTYVPPGFPLILSLWIGWSGNDFFSYRLLMALIGALTSLSCVCLMWRLCGPDMAILIGGIFSINHTIVLNSTYTSSDIPFTFFCFLGFHFILTAARHKESVVLIGIAGLFAGIPALIRINGWGLPPALVIFLWSGFSGYHLSYKVSRCLAFLVSAYSLPALWEFHKSGFPVSLYEGEYLRAVAGRSLETQVLVVLQSMWEYFFETAFALTGISMRIGVLEIALSFLIIIGLVIAYRKGERLFSAFTAIQMAGLFLSSAGSRYMAPLIPGLYLFLGLGLLNLARAVNLRFSSAMIAPASLITGLFVSLGATNLGADLQTIYHSRTAIERHGPESSRDAPFFAAAKWIKTNDAQGPILSMNPRIIRYLTRVKTIDLLRSGVPEHLAWASTQDEISSIMRNYQPKYVFIDSKNQPLKDTVMGAILHNDYQLVEIEEARAGDRFSLWKIVKPVK